MSEHPFCYSMVVDDQPLHPYQAENLLFTLEKYGEVPRDRIVVQCTDRVSEHVRSELARNRYTVAVIPPYLDGKYCNKVSQLDYFVAEGLSRACGVFLLDLDFVVLSSLDPIDRGRIWGKIVDNTSPPPSVLERIFAEAEVEIAGTMPCDWGTGDTVVTNFNGGFLYVPREFVPRMQTAWRKWAEFLHARPDLFEQPAHRVHTDQIAFALALSAERISYGHLTANWNFPLHSSKSPRSFKPEDSVRGLHYHRCLDTFGLVDPVFKDNSVIDAAVRRVNAALGARDESLFFDLYKRHLAREAARSVPDAKATVFSEDFIARTWNGRRKRRLILHAGTVETDTASLQRHLATNPTELARQGFWYPTPSQCTPIPKHQRLVDLLRREDSGAFGDYIEDALSDMPDETHSIIFSIAGIYDHWWDYTPKAKGLLRRWAALFDFELCVWFREPESFTAALYVQNLRHDPTDDVMRNVFGRDIACLDALQDPWFLRHLDYLGFCHEARLLFGDERVRTFLHAGNTVQAFASHYGLVSLKTPVPGGRNATPGAAAVHMLRRLNRVTLERSRRHRRIGFIERVDRVIGREFRMSERERKLVARYARRGWNVVRREAEPPVRTRVPATG